MLLHFTEMSQYCRCSGPFGFSFILANGLKINYEFIPSGGAVITASGTVVCLSFHCFVKWFHHESSE